MPKAIGSVRCSMQMGEPKRRSVVILAILLTSVVVTLPAVVYGQTKYAHIGDGDARIYRMYGYDELWGSIPKGLKVEYLDQRTYEDVVWYQVSYLGKIGWVEGKYIKGFSGDITIPDRPRPSYEPQPPAKPSQDLEKRADPWIRGVLIGIFSLAVLALIFLAIREVVILIAFGPKQSSFISTCKGVYCT